MYHLKTFPKEVNEEKSISVQNALIQAQQDSSKQCQLLMYLNTTLDTLVSN